jgi:hypothetical protein
MGWLAGLLFVLLLLLGGKGFKIDRGYQRGVSF